MASPEVFKTCLLMTCHFLITNSNLKHKVYKVSKNVSLKISVEEYNRDKWVAIKAEI